MHMCVCLCVQSVWICFPQGLWYSSLLCKKQNKKKNQILCWIGYHPVQLCCGWTPLLCFG